MGLKLEQIVPWGRSQTEYWQMFDLRSRDLNGKKILDCGGGPASFNAEMTQQGYSVVSCDPVYQFSATEISQRIQDTYPVILQGVTANLSNYVWDTIASPEELGQVRMQAMQRFLEDFPLGLQQQRYLAAELPTLPFPDRAFDLALCSHLLFTYSDHLSLAFHLASLREMLRVAHQVRIFPLVNLDGQPSPWLEPTIATLQTEGYAAQICPVPYEFQRGGDRQLILGGRKKSSKELAEN